MTDEKGEERGWGDLGNDFYDLHEFIQDYQDEPAGRILETESG